MKTNLNSAFNLVFVALFATMLGCKKQEMLIPSNESRSVQNTLHSSIVSAESESLLTTLDEWGKIKQAIKASNKRNKDSVEAEKATTLEIKKDANNNIIIYNQRPGYGLRWSVINKYLIIDENEKEFTFTTLKAFGTKTETGLNGNIRVFRDGKLIFSNQPAPIFTMEGIYKVLSPSAMLDIRVNTQNNVIVANRNPGYGLNESFWNSDANYSIMDEDGRKFDFTSKTTFPAKTVTSLFGNKLKIMKGDKVLFDNLPELKPLFTIQEEKSHYKANSQYPTCIIMAILDIKINSNGNIVIDNKNPRSKLSTLDPIGQYLIQDEHGKQFYFLGGLAFSARTETGLSGKIRISKDGHVLFSQL